MNKWAAVRSAIAGTTGILMFLTVAVQASRKSFELEAILALLIALLPSAIFALTIAERRRVLIYGTIHSVLIVGLALLYLIGLPPIGVLLALLIYSIALINSIVAVADRS